MTIPQRATQPTDARSPPCADTLLVSAADLARELRLSIRTIRRMDASGALPRPIRFSSGAVIRWRRADIVAWLAAGCPRRGAMK
jgi:predicted DNA-binding transcriptional regulator AlpA